MAWFVIPLFFLIALIYSSVGFGGGSMYLAVLTFSSISQDSLRITALVCNTVVTATGSMNFLRECRTSAQRIIPLLACSV
ncbi:MAG: sulfite exporter TauE/SafE family protein, partial [Flavobacteriales bacterium]